MHKKHKINNIKDDVYQKHIRWLLSHDIMKSDFSPN